jgi:hypothetical protein
MADPKNASLQTQAPSAAAAQNLVGFGPTANRPGNPPTGFLYYDTTIGREFVWNGTTWQDISPPISPVSIPVGYGTTAQRPASPPNGYLYFDTTLGYELTFSNGAFVPSSPVPTASTPTHYSLASSGGAASRSVFMTAGTWQLTLVTHGQDLDGSNSDFTVTQNGSVIGAGMVTTSFHMYRSGGAGFGRGVGGSAVATINIVVPSSGNYTMSIDPAQAAGNNAGQFTAKGSVLTVDKMS